MAWLQNKSRGSRSGVGRSNFKIGRSRDLQRQSPYSKPITRRAVKDAARVGRVLGTLDVLIVVFGDHRIATCFRVINCDYDRMLMGITAQCLPIVIG